MLLPCLLHPCKSHVKAVGSTATSPQLSSPHITSAQLSSHHSQDCGASVSLPNVDRRAGSRAACLRARCSLVGFQCMFRSYTTEGWVVALLARVHPARPFSAKTKPRSCQRQAGATELDTRGDHSNSHHHSKSRQPKRFEPQSKQKIACSVCFVMSPQPLSRRVRRPVWVRAAACW